MSDEFTLYDLSVSVIGDPNEFACSHVLGKNFTVKGENIIFDGETEAFSMYALSSILPLLPAKQRQTDAFDWMSTDHVIACPDPNCAAQFKIERVGETAFSHSEVTKTSLESAA